MKHYSDILENSTCLTASLLICLGSAWSDGGASKGSCWLVLSNLTPQVSMLWVMLVLISCSVSYLISLQWIVSFVLCRLMAPLWGLSVCSMDRFWPFTSVWLKVVLWFATVLAKKQPKPRAHFTCKCLWSYILTQIRSNSHIFHF